MVVVGQGNFSYDVEEHWSNGPRPSLKKGWGELPKGYSYIQVPGIGVDSKDRIYVYNRYPPRVYVLDNNGKFLNMWGEDVFGDSWLHSPHGLYVGSDDMVYCTDNLDHTVRKYTLDGELIFILGTEGKPGKEGAPFNRPTATALSKSGDLFISDGYGNSRVCARAHVKSGASDVSRHFEKELTNFLGKITEHSLKKKDKKFSLF